MSTRLVAVYALIDPRDDSTRYIGRTFNLAARAGGHVPHRGENKVKRAWLKDLWATGLRAKVVVLEWCRDVVTAARVEDELTARARAEGQPLTNGKGKRGHVGGTGAMRHPDHAIRSYFSVRALERQRAAEKGGKGK